MKKDLVDIFYNDIIENFECSYVIVEYMLNKNIEGFNELLNNGIDRCVEFGKNLLITDSFPPVSAQRGNTKIPARKRGGSGDAGT